MARKLDRYRRSARMVLERVAGAVLIAAERTGRRARAMEIDAASVDVAVRRWQAYAGKAATLEATGQTFEEVEEGLDPAPAAGSEA